MTNEEPKVTIHEFDPVIYPRKVWIAVGKGQFEDRFDGVSEWNDNADAVVDKAYDRIDRKGGVFIRFESVEYITGRTITHESNHSAMDIFGFIGAEVDIDNQEPFCYLAGWIAQCCEEVKRIESEKLKLNENK